MNEMTAPPRAARLTSHADPAAIEAVTRALAARFGNLVAVVAGTTLGMLIADVPVILIGKLAANKIPFKAMRIVAAGLFAVLAVLTLVAN